MAKVSRGAVNPAMEDSCSAKGKSWPSDVLTSGSDSCKHFVSAVVMMWAGSLQSAYVVTVTFVFAEPGPVSRVP